MSERRIIVHRRIMIGALILAVGALPFSIKVCHGAIIVVIAAWLCEGSWRSKSAIVSQSILVQLTILLFLLQIAGLAFSDNLTRGWFSIEKKIFLLALPLVLATSVIRLGRRELNLIFTAFIATCFAGTLVCIFSAWQVAIDLTAGAIPPTLATNSSYPDLADGQSANWLLFSYINLADGIGIHPTYFSLYLALCVMVLLDSLPSLKTQLLKIPATLLILYFTVFIMLLSSRIIILGVCLVYFFLFIRSVIRRQVSLGLMTVGVSAIFVFMLFVNPVTHFRSLEEINSSTFTVEPGTHYTTAAHIRVSLWWLALNSLKKSDPLVGSGTGDVPKVMATSSAAFGVTNVIRSFDPHNQYLYTWLANGIPTLVVMLLCLLLPAWWSWIHRDFLLLGFTLLICLVCMTESALELQKGIAFYALISGLLFFHRQSFQNISLNLKSLLRVREERPL